MRNALRSITRFRLHDLLVLSLGLSIGIVVGDGSHQWKDRSLFQFPWFGSTTAIAPFDGLLIRATAANLNYPISDIYAVDPEGRIDLGPVYGTIKVGNLSSEEAEKDVRTQLSKFESDAEVQLSVAFRAKR